MTLMFPTAGLSAQEGIDLREGLPKISISTKGSDTPGGRGKAGGIKFVKDKSNTKMD